MAINPENITTIRVDQLASLGLTLESLFPHTNGTELVSSPISDLVTLVASTIETGTGVGYLPISVTDGQQLPDVPANPGFFLCGAGTYLNINGFADLICTEALNAIMSVDDHWEIAVQIPVTPLSGAVQSVTGSAVDNTDPLNPVINLSSAVTSVNGLTGAVVVDGDNITVTDPTTSTDADLNDALQNIFDSSGGGVPTLQDVTDAGNSTTNAILIKDGSDNNKIKLGEDPDIGDITCLDPSNPTQYISMTAVQIVASLGANISILTHAGIRILSFPNVTAYLINKITNNGVDYPLPTGAPSPLATLADIPIINERFKGAYTSESALETAHPTANVGDYATVDTGSGSNAVQYIWDAQEGWVASGSISPSTTDALPEGTSNLYFTVARVLASALTGISFSDGTDVTSANNVLQALGKLQKQLTDVRAAKEDKRSWMSQSTPRTLDNTTALQKIFNVGSSGNGSFPVIAGRKYRVRGWAIFSGLTSTSKTISFGILGTATASYVSGVSQAVISVALTNGQTQTINSFSATQISFASATTAARIYINFEFNCNGSGTFIPSILFSAAQANMNVDSAYFDIVDIGDSSANATSNIV